MVLELLQQEKYLTYAIIVVSLIWAFIALRLLFLHRAKEPVNNFDFDNEYERIITSDEFKVKRKYEA